MSEKKDMHLVKKVSKELGMTYKELGEAIGYSEGTLRSSVSKNEISLQLKKALELYLENVKLKKNKENVDKTKTAIKAFINNSIEEKEILTILLKNIVKEKEVLETFLRKI